MKQRRTHNDDDAKKCFTYVQRISSECVCNLAVRILPGQFHIANMFDFSNSIVLVSVISHQHIMLCSSLMLALSAASRKSPSHTHLCGRYTTQLFYFSHYMRENVRAYEKFNQIVVFWYARASLSSARFLLFELDNVCARTMAARKMSTSRHMSVCVSVCECVRTSSRGAWRQCMLWTRQHVPNAMQSGLHTRNKDFVCPTHI